ncbi:MAG: YraN family protein [Rhodobacteraceae bacterium]|nr:YraN family protein [Paracoccaceae bacterium]
MAADSVPDPVPAPTRQRAERGLRAWHSGFSAEEAVARRYQALGYAVAARRWRGLSGEIDLVLQRPGEVIFVEVKQAQTHALAAERLGPAQILRIHGASEEYVDRVMGRPAVERQYHLALVDGAGRIAVLDDAFLVM